MEVKISRRSHRHVDSNPRRFRKGTLLLQEPLSTPRGTLHLVQLLIDMPGGKDPNRYRRAFGDGPRNFESWLSDVDDTRAASPSPNYHTNGRAFQLSTDLTCIAALHGGSSVVLRSN
ncbi:hypothetical protein TNCV_3694751 [Trichonephila clavipes]|nr:hypothetical protein TNCV_3694751 [Trichonephila clavipes]